MAFAGYRNPRKDTQMKNKWLYLCIFFLFKFAFAATDITTEKVMNVSGLTTKIDYAPIFFYRYERTLQYIIQSGKKRIEKGSPVNKDAALKELDKLSSDIERIKFNVNTLMNTVNNELSQPKNSSNFESIKNWYENKLGKQLLNTEIALYKDPNPDEEVRRYFSTTSETSIKKTRWELLETIDDVRHISIHRIQQAVFFSDISAYMSGISYTPEQRNKMLTMMQEHAHKSTAKRLQYQYRMISDNELIEYIEFLTSPGGQTIINTIDLIEDSMLKSFNAELNKYLIHLNLSRGGPSQVKPASHSIKKGITIGGYDPDKSNATVSREAIENEYNKLPLFQALNKHQPAAYNNIIDLVESAQNNRANSQAVAANVGNILGSVKYQSLLQANDELVIEYFENIRDIIAELKAVSDDACFAYVEPLAENKATARELIPQELTQKENDIFVRLVQSLNPSSPATSEADLMDKSEATDLTQGFYRDYTLFLGEEEREAYTNAMMSPNDPHTQKSYVCQLKIDYYNNFLDLPTHEAAAFFKRSIYKG